MEAMNRGNKRGIYMGNWTQIEKDGYLTWVGQTNLFSLTIIPELGSKAVSLVNRKTGREWLWRSGKSLGNCGYGSSFAASDESGWDEMFPGINPCLYPLQPPQSFILALFLSLGCPSVISSAGGHAAA